MPKPRPGESRDDFVSRCMADPAEVEARPDASARYARCLGIYESERSAMDGDKLLELVRQRGEPGRTWGVIRTADCYVRSLADCAGIKACERLYPGQKMSLDAIVKEAGRKLVYGPAEDERSPWTRQAGEDELELPPHTLMVFRHVLTTPRKDRDGDILRTDGATLDPKMLMLWQHIHTLPIGKMVRVSEHNAKRLVLVSALVDMNELAHDAAVMVEAGMGRFSHGFRALEFEELKAEDGDTTSPGGFDVKRFEIMEESLVSVPSNVDAQTEEVLLTLVGQKRLKSGVVKAIARRLQKRRPVSVPVSKDVGQLTLKLGGAEIEVRVPESNKSRTKSKPRSGKQLGTLRKMFDVETEQLQPTTTEYDWIARFCGCGVKDLFVTSTTAGGPSRGSFLCAIEELTAGMAAKDVRNFSYHDGCEMPPVRESVQLNSRERRTFLVEGTTFYAADGWPLVVKTSEHYSGQWFMFGCKREDAARAEKLIADAWEWVERNHKLRGEAFAVSGGFIERTGTDWGELFLPGDVERTLKRTAKLVNAKGAELPNRGLILQGPPGTGKTLSARVLLNQTTATFVWVSAKDFWRGGAASSIAGGFAIARTLAPTILLIEDVDNWLSDRTVDMVKTEMDGLARSRGVVTILTTNYPERLPDSLIDRPGRFHDVLTIGLPDKSVRTRMLRSWLPQAGDECLAKAAERTEGYSGAHVYELSYFARTLREEDEKSVSWDDAVMLALRKVDEQREQIDERQRSGSSYRRSAAAAWEKSARAAVRFESTPSSTASWDADAAVGRLRSWSGVDGDEPTAAQWAQYRRGFARVTGDGSKLGDFDYPHHDVSGGRLVVVRAAITAGIGAINGGRGGGVFESESERRAVYNHLAAHLREDFDVPDDQVPELRSAEPEGEKRGRVLSRANLDKLKSVRDDLKELGGTEMTRQQSALCERCVRRLDEVIATQVDEEQEAGKSFGSTVDVVLWLAELGELDPSKVSRLRDTLTGLCDAADRELRTREYTRLGASR